MASRLSVIDGLKVLASQTIVLHHLSSYGPVSDAAHVVFPWFFDWLFGYGRMAVQVFLVAGGFLAARSLAPEGMLGDVKPIDLFTRRYVRLVVPLAGAVLIAIVCSKVVRGVMIDDAIPAAPGIFQLLAHFFLLQDLLGVPALSAGVWYVAIDFQLYSLTALLLWFAMRAGRTACWVRFLGLLLISGLAAMSLFLFNRESAWDVAAPYHFAAYAMGVLCYWLTRNRELPLFWCGVVVLAVIASLVVDFRPRIALALTVAVFIGLSVRTGFCSRHLDSVCVKQLSRESYSLFLIHFPVCLLANALFANCGWQTGGLAVLTMVVAWLVSLYLAKLFYRKIETRAEQVLAALTFAGYMRSRGVQKPVLGLSALSSRT